MNEGVQVNFEDGKFLSTGIVLPDLQVINKDPQWFLWAKKVDQLYGGAFNSPLSDAFFSNKIRDQNKGEERSGRDNVNLVVGATSFAQGDQAWSHSDGDWHTNNGNKWGATGKATLDITIGAIAVWGGPLGWVVGGGIL